MTLLQSIILGVVEGFTEFLPISSTGHLILASRLLGLTQTEFQKSFEIAIQLGAIASVVMLYWRKFLQPAVLSRVIAAFIPTGIVGFALYHVVKTYLFGSDTIVLWALGLGGVALIVFELLHQEADDAVADELDLLSPSSGDRPVPEHLHHPGRVAGGRDHRRRPDPRAIRSTIVEFSFLLAVPTMLAATFYDLYKNASSFAPEQFGVLAVGFVSSFWSPCSASSSCWPMSAPIPSFRSASPASWSLSPSPFCEGQRPQPFDRGRGRFGPNWGL